MKLLRWVLMALTCAGVLAGDPYNSIKISRDLALSDVARILNRHGEYTGNKILGIRFMAPDWMRVTVGSVLEEEGDADQIVELRLDGKAGWKVQSVVYRSPFADAALEAKGGVGGKHSIKIAQDCSLSEMARILNRDPRTRVDFGETITSMTMITSVVPTSAGHLIVGVSPSYENAIDPMQGVRLGFNKISGWHMLSHAELMSVVSHRVGPLKVIHDLSLSDIARMLNRHGKYFGGKVVGLRFESAERMNVYVGREYDKTVGGEQVVKFEFDRQSGWHIQSVDYSNKLSDATIAALAGDHEEHFVKIARDWSFSDLARVVNRNDKIRSDKIEGIGISPDHLELGLTTDYRAMAGGGQDVHLEFDKKSGWRITGEIVGFDK